MRGGAATIIGVRPPFFGQQRNYSSMSLVKKSLEARRAYKASLNNPGSYRSRHRTTRRNLARSRRGRSTSFTPDDDLQSPGAGPSCLRKKKAVHDGDEDDNELTGSQDGDGGGDGGGDDDAE